MLRKNILKQERSETVPRVTSATMISIPDVASVLGLESHRTWVHRHTESP
jgi:hypothetical protein